jgi:hypothetical protein
MHQRNAPVPEIVHDMRGFDDVSRIATFRGRGIAVQLLAGR